MIDWKHHLFTRKLVHQKLQPYPHPIAWKRNLDRIIYAISIIGPAAAIPQVLAIWQRHDAGGVSLVSWIFFTIFSVFWFAYGIAHNVRPIMINSGIYFILNILIVVGVILYS